MTQEQVWHEFVSLPPIAQREVQDFIAFLRTRYAPDYLLSSKDLTVLQDEPFIGMWRDREDMSDSSQWVRQVCSAEWGKRVATLTIVDTEILIDAGPGNSEISDYKGPHHDNNHRCA